MATLDLDGTRISYRIDGEGPRTLAFAHGWCSHSAHWDEVADRFVGDHRVLRWDRRGLGQSPTTRPADTPARHAADLAAILDTEQIDQVVMIAHAGGGPTALNFATLHSARTDALVLVDIVLHGPEDAANAERISNLIEALSGPDSDAILSRMYRGFFGPATPSDVVDAACANAVATDRAVAIAELHHVVTDTKAAARSVARPVLWISARPDDEGALGGLFTDVMIGRVAGSGHFPQVEVPDQVEAMLRTFLTQRPAP